jgi:hypothetical protein
MNILNFIIDNIGIVITVSVSVAISIAIVIRLNITGHINLNKLFYELKQHYITKKYNKKANDYNRLFPFFHSNLIQSPSGELAKFLYEHYNTLIFYPDYEKEKIFVLKNDIKRKNKANSLYLTELNNSPLGNGHITTLNDKDKLCKSDYYCHKKLSNDFKYFLKLNELMESNYTFQKIIQAKWNFEAKMKLEEMKQNENLRKKYGVQQNGI